MGAIFNLRIEEEVNLIDKLAEFKKHNYQTYFADMNGLDYRKINTNEKSDDNLL